MNWEAFGRAQTERLLVQKGGDTMEDKAKIVLRWVVLGALLSSVLIGIAAFLGPGCSCGGLLRPSQVIANKCQCEDDDSMADPGEAKRLLDFTSVDRGTDAVEEEDRSCTVWVLMEHLSKTRVWIDTRVRCQR